MTIRTRTHTHSVTTLEHDDIEVELQHEPIEWREPLVERIDNKLVVAYLVQDSDPSNPMENSDCNGDIYTKKPYMGMDQTITDNDSELYSALGLDGNGEVDIDQSFHLDGERVTLRELAEQQIRDANPEMQIDDEDDGDRYESLATDLYTTYWQDIAGPYVVPISYHAERGGVSMSATTWDGDPDDLPDGVWVACSCAEGNIRTPVDPGLGGDGPKTLAESAFAYADAVVREYASWAEGDVYGCVVETFEMQGGEWAQIDEDACWGYVGGDYAEQTLKTEHFNPTVARLRAA